MLSILGFILCAAIILYTGKKLSYYGDVIAEKTGLGKAWVGLVLMASVTSLPELVTGISASAIIGSADLAVGNVLGACSLNLGILALLDSLVPNRKPLFGSASQSHVLAASLGIILFVLVGFGLAMRREIVLTPWIGIGSLICISIYLFSMRLMYLYQLKSHPASPEAKQEAGYRDVNLKQTIVRFVLFSLLIIITALALPYFAENIARLTGLGETFVGTVFLAISTTLPEVAVSFSAIRMGSIDLAVGNYLGSNIFNIFILGVDELFYTKGFLIIDASAMHLLSVFSIILMSAVVIIGLIYRPQGKRYKLAWDAGLIFLIYLLNLVLIYQYTS